MFSTVLSATLRGLMVEFVHVEADISNGLPVFHMVGDLSSEVKEASERVRTAIKNSGFDMPAKRIVVNLSPANIRKKGSMFDLPIAIAILASLGEMNVDRLQDILVVGELSLDGRVKSVPGVLSMVNEAKKMGCKICIVPKENKREALLVDGVRIVSVSSLQDVCQFLRGQHDRNQDAARDCKCEKFDAENVVEEKRKFRGNSRSKNSGASGGDNNVNAEKRRPDYSDIHGQQFAKRAAEIAVAGNHNLLMAGPPGSGKSMIAKRIPTILPELTKEESLELTSIYSVLGALNPERPLIVDRPFREVHQSVTKAGLLGGGTVPKPGEISLAHRGVLFLDELAEFPKSILELLRQPIEEHSIRIIRERGEYVFPADFLLVAAMNPCPCGNYPDLNRCTCTTPQIRNYLGRISQPFLDRMDLCVEVEKVQYEHLQSEAKEESSEAIRGRVQAAREIQKERYQGTDISVNAQLTVKDVEKYCQLTRGDEKLMQHAFDKLNLTARTYYKVLKVARTIADLAGEEQITSLHLSEALGYRSMDQKYWGNGTS